jgi:hypothetical protein
MSTTVAVLLMVAVAFVAGLIRHRADEKHLNDLRQEARSAIAAMRVTSADSNLQLDGATAEIERLEETGGVRGVLDRRADFSVTAFVRNHAGERFLIRWNSLSARPPFVKHLGN